MWELMALALGIGIGIAGLAAYVKTDVHPFVMDGGGV